MINEVLKEVMQPMHVNVEDGIIYIYIQLTFPSSLSFILDSKIIVRCSFVVQPGTGHVRSNLQ